MKNQKIYNLDKLIKIEKIPSRESEKFFWTDGLKIFNFYLIIPSVRWVYNKSICRELPSNCVVKDKKVMTKPRCILYFECDHYLVLTYDTDEEMENDAKNYAENFDKKVYSQN
jgi:hypothetical protein